MFGSSGKASNPLGTVGALVGAIGAGFSVILWIYRFSPDSTILGKYAVQMGPAGTLPGQLGTLALIFGGMAIVLGIIGGLGGRGGASTIASILFGIVGVSYPILNGLNLIQREVPNPVGN